MQPALKFLQCQSERRAAIGLKLLQPDGIGESVCDGHHELDARATQVSCAAIDPVPVSLR